jgi:hypothetical protein
MKVCHLNKIIYIPILISRQTFKALQKAHSSPEVLPHLNASLPAGKVGCENFILLREILRLF